jgi:hypothetical protein
MATARRTAATVNIMAANSSGTADVRGIRIANHRHRRA